MRTSQWASILLASIWSLILLVPKLMYFSLRKAILTHFCVTFIVYYWSLITESSTENLRTCLKIIEAYALLCGEQLMAVSIYSHITTQWVQTFNQMLTYLCMLLSILAVWCAICTSTVCLSIAVLLIFLYWEFLPSNWTSILMNQSLFIHIE